MAFVKLDCGILNSTTWVEKDVRDVFITSLLMASPYEAKEEMEQIEVRSLERTGFTVQPGWYGFVPSASFGIIRQAMIDEAAGMLALEKLGSEDPESRSPEFGGRRMIRVDGGFLILNYQKYRDKDHTAAERQRRYRERQKELRRDVDAVTRNITQEEEEEEAELKQTPKSYDSDFLEFWEKYPRKEDKKKALVAWKRLSKTNKEKALKDIESRYSETERKFIPLPTTYIHGERWDDVNQGSMHDDVGIYQ